MAAVLNPIIRKGGTTAIQTEFTADGLRRLIFTELDLICCHVAQDRTGHVAGFQWLSHEDDDRPDVGDIATFARLSPKLPGVGSALFRVTRAAAMAAGLTALTARIRADNIGGLVYYGKMGFRDHDVAPGVPLEDGTPIDRVTKLIML